VPSNIHYVGIRIANRRVDDQYKLTLLFLLHGTTAPQTRRRDIEYYYNILYTINVIFAGRRHRRVCIIIIKH